LDLDFHQAEFKFGADTGQAPLLTCSNVTSSSLLEIAYKKPTTPQMFSNPSSLPLGLDQL
jgi:hypothetical protein